MFEVSFFQASRKVEFFPWRRLNYFSLLVSALLRLGQWFGWASFRVRLVLNFVCLFVFRLTGKAEWGGKAICWWFGLYFCFACCLDDGSCKECPWWLDDAGSCIQVALVVWVLTIWYSLGLVLWWSRVLESVLLVQRLRAWSLVRNEDPTSCLLWH